MLVVGLTGGIGAGKSTVARLLAERGAVVIDMDAIGREVIAPGGRAESRVIKEFGDAIVAADGSIDRALLAGIVFGDAGALDRLTSISHPAMNDELLDRLRALSPDAVVVLDLAVLVESQLGRFDPPYGYSYVVTVEADADLRVDRAVARGTSRDDVRRRIARQATDRDRRAVADFVITNDGTPEALSAQVGAFWDVVRGLSSTK
jgi:dephospho-CoA kinase